MKRPLTLAFSFRFRFLRCSFLPNSRFETRKTYECRRRKHNSQTRYDSLTLKASISRKRKTSVQRHVSWRPKIRYPLIERKREPKECINRFLRNGRLETRISSECKRRQRNPQTRYRYRLVQWIREAHVTHQFHLRQKSPENASL
jgi:hypothetical protein